MHEGECCSRLGLPGWPSIAEELMVHRDIELSRLTGAPVHLLHLSTARQRRARASGEGRRSARSRPRRRRTTSRSPTSARRLRPDLQGQPAAAPGVGRRGDQAGLADGTIDAIATDHAPHPPETKELPLDHAPPGMLGLETALGVALAISTWLSTTSSPRCRGSRHRSPASAIGTGGRSSPVSRPTSPCSIRTSSGRCSRRGLASKSHNTPYVGTPCGAGCVTRSSTAIRSSSTEYPNDEWIYS